MTALLHDVAMWLAEKTSAPGTRRSALAPGTRRSAQSDGDGVRLAAIQVLLTHVEPAYHERCRRMLHGEAFSFAQAWQDWYIFQNHFHDRLTWGGGTFVEIGANQPTVISNTLFFEKCLGWRGVLFEPQERYHAGIRSARNGSTLVPSCVVGRGETNGTYMMRGMWLERRRSDAPRTANDRCVDAGEVLPQLLGRGARVDLLSIDIEGMEPRVLRCFPFRRLRVQSVLIETNQVDVREADLFFHRHGYANAETFIGGNAKKGTVGWLDNYYVRAGKQRRYPPVSYRCDSAAWAHRLAWCTPWLPWFEGTNVPQEPVDGKLHFGRCKAV